MRVSCAKKEAGKEGSLASINKKGENSMAFCCNFTVPFGAVGLEKNGFVLFVYSLTKTIFLWKRALKVPAPNRIF